MWGPITEGTKYAGNKLFSREVAGARLDVVFCNVGCSSKECIEKESLKITVSYRGIFYIFEINLINSKATDSLLQSVCVQITNGTLLDCFQKYVAQPVFCCAEQDRRGS